MVAVLAAERPRHFAIPAPAPAGPLACQGLTPFLLVVGSSEDFPVSSDTLEIKNGYILVTKILLETKKYHFLCNVNFCIICVLKQLFAGSTIVSQFFYWGIFHLALAVYHSKWCAVSTTALGFLLSDILFSYGCIPHQMMCSFYYSFSGFYWGILHLAVPVCHIKWCAVSTIASWIFTDGYFI